MTFMKKTKRSILPLAALLFVLTALAAASVIYASGAGNADTPLPAASDGDTGLDVFMEAEAAVAGIPFDLSGFAGGETITGIKVYTVSVTEGAHYLVKDVNYYFDGVSEVTFLKNTENEPIAGPVYIFLAGEGVYVEDETTVSFDGSPSGGICKVILKNGVRPYPDLNGDDELNALDLIGIRKAYADPAIVPAADLNGDDKTDGADFKILAEYILNK